MRIRLQQVTFELLDKIVSSFGQSIRIHSSRRCLRPGNKNVYKGVSALHPMPILRRRWQFDFIRIFMAALNTDTDRHRT